MLRNLTQLLFAAVVAASVCPAHAQVWAPTKPISIIVPVATASSNDLIARVLAERLPARLGPSAGRQPTRCQREIGTAALGLR